MIFSGFSVSADGSQLQSGSLRTYGLVFLLFLCALAHAATADAQGIDLDADLDLTQVSEATLAVIANSSHDQVRTGAALFDFHCSSCHGDSASGFAEAKLSFPEDHRTCTKCHRTSNPPQMSMDSMRYNFAFDIGNPPALRGPGVLAHFGNALALDAYLRATMPRPFPGSLADEDYWAITAFLLVANGADLPYGISLGADNGGDYPLR